MKRVLFLAVLIACSDEEPKREPLPGAIYFLTEAHDPDLVRYAQGSAALIGHRLFPTTQQLPDGRVVAISSRGDGSSDSEQLALVDRNGRVERIGPTAPQIRDPAVDIRGRWITVAANFDGHSDLYRVELDGKATRVTANPEGNFAPARLGESVVYASSRDGNSELYRDGQRLTVTDRDDWQATPSPDGKSIVFLSDRDGAAHLYMMDADGGNQRRLTTHVSEESEPTWSPDGKQLAYVAGSQLWLRDMTSGTERALTVPGARELEPSFSPDGRWLAFARMRGRASDIFAIDLASGETTRVASDARLPRWL